MKQRLHVLRLQIECPHADVAAALLFEAGASGLEERNVGSTDHLIVYGNDPEELRRLAEAVRTGIPACALHRADISELDDRGWNEEWKRYLVPERLGERFVLQPISDTTPAPTGRQVILYTPQMAFGVGSHPTTRLAATSVERRCLEQTGARLLDVGTGSGVLAMIGLHSGAGQALALDIDPVAVAAARENLELNALDARARVEGTALSEVHEVFDVVAANVELPSLLTLGADLVRVTATGGWLIVTGFLEERADEVLTEFVGRGLELCHRTRDGDWLLFELRAR